MIYHFYNLNSFLMLFSVWQKNSSGRCLSLYLSQVGMFKIHPEIPESMSAEAKAFILRCFEPDPDKRAFAHELLIDEFLKVSSKKRKSPSKLSGKHC